MLLLCPLSYALISNTSSPPFPSSPTPQLSPLPLTPPPSLTPLPPPLSLPSPHRPVGMPRSHVVQVTNNHSRTVQITSVSGNSLSFHPSLLQTKVVAPGESVSFDVIFLPREEGPTNGMLYIHTSLGTLYYEVRGGRGTWVWHRRFILQNSVCFDCTITYLCVVYNGMVKEVCVCYIPLHL